MTSVASLRASLYITSLVSPLCEAVPGKATEGQQGTEESSRSGRRGS